ncbi:cytochrome P450 [Flagelloscypha sp. PMI_526]|nr:cytochrome P450 [Flagelloscypha sp. PMI_526]
MSYALVFIGLGVLSFATFRRFRNVRQIVAPILKISGPTSWNLLLGNIQAIEDASKSFQYFTEYGSTYRIDALLGNKILVTRDLKAIQFLTSNPDLHEKPAASQYFLKRLLGEGVLVVEHEIHKRQRRILNPAFGPAQIRELTQVFNSEALQVFLLCEQLRTVAHGTHSINIMTPLAECTMQIIGRGGFDFDFRAQSSGLPSLFKEIFKGPGSYLTLAIEILKAPFPSLRWIPTSTSTMIRDAKYKMDQIGQQLIRKTKEEASALASNHPHGLVDKSAFTKRDILSILIRANMASDIPVDQRLSDEEVIAQIPTFIVAGSETTSNALSWTIYALCKHPHIQNKLREELLSLSPDNPTMEELNSLPYLGNVVKEVLRLYSPVTMTARQAIEDHVVPLGTPVTDRDGKIVSNIVVRKGQQIFIHIQGVNKDPSIWGPDAEEFRPERWDSTVSDAALAVPGVWSNQLTFLGGHRACIGFRFSLVEMKAILVPLVKSFTFELGVDPEKIYGSPDAISRPSVRGDKHGINTLPVIIKPYNSE